MRDVQASGIPGQTIADGVRAVTTTWFVLAVGVAVVAVHLVLRQVRPALALAVLLVVLPLFQTGIKELVDRPRPSEVAADIEIRASQTSPSFPAGHVMSPTVVYGWALIMLVRPVVRSRGVRVMGSPSLPVVRSPEVQPANGGQHPGLNPGATHGLVRSVRLLLIASMAAVLLLTGIVNVYLGVHWPTDIAGGYLWGFVLLLPGLGTAQISGRASPPLASLP